MTPRYLSSDRLELIKQIFRIKQGCSFGELKQLQAFLLLSNNQLQCDPRLIPKARSVAELMTAEVLPVLCTCGYREKMATLLGWSSAKSTDLFMAAAAYGPAISYCVPDKKQIVRFLACHLTSINPYTSKIDLQDRLYSVLVNKLSTSLLSLDIRNVLRFGVIKDQAVHPEHAIVIPTDQTIHSLALIILRAVGLPASFEYQVELPDGMILRSPESLNHFRCQHRLRADLIFLLDLNVCIGCRLRMLFFDHHLLPLNIILLGVAH